MLNPIYHVAVCVLFPCMAVSALAADQAQPAQPPGTASAPSPVVRWRHPAGIVTDDTIAEIKSKVATRDWARKVYADRRKALAVWVEVPYERLKSVFPKKRGNVYHNFSCPSDRTRLTFDPFTSDTFKCPSCGKSYSADTDAGIY